MKIITNKDVREGIKNGTMRTLEEGNIQIVELDEGKVYQARKMNRLGNYVTFVRFNDKNLKEALETIKQYYI